MKFGVSGIALVWLSIVVTGLALAAWYTGSPGVSATAPELWPSESRIPLDPSRATLVMFAHPRCPCTRASLSELDRLLARCPVQINVQVVFLKPAGMNEVWVRTELWRKAASIPGVAVRSDLAGAEARRFRAETSGEALLYGPDGRLRFAGGITIARGHEGDNPGRSAILDLLREGKHGHLGKPDRFGVPPSGGMAHAPRTASEIGSTLDVGKIWPPKEGIPNLAGAPRAPVFGCALFDNKDQEGVVQCKQ